MDKRGITWGKIVLLFQAVITLLIGIIFFFQVTSLDEHGIQELKVILSESPDKIEENYIGEKFIDISKRFETAGYILLIVSLIEILIISRFMD